VPPHLKYESQGGPGVPELAGILRRSEAAQADLDTLFTALVVFWMLAAPDGHAKNFSLRLLPGGRFRLTPLYDVMSIWPVEGTARTSGRGTRRSSRWPCTASASTMRCATSRVGTSLRWRNIACSAISLRRSSNDS
jgi:hypothetical protein